jgi:hypothetical protein
MGHPIKHCPRLPAEQRIALLENYLAMLWDEVWWHQLPFYKRWWYRLQGFRSPIDEFYDGG